jgi:hypothetical protein
VECPLPDVPAEPDFPDLVTFRLLDPDSWEWFAPPLPENTIAAIHRRLIAGANGSTPMPTGRHRAWYRACSTAMQAWGVQWSSELNFTNYDTNSRPHEELPSVVVWNQAQSASHHLGTSLQDD